MQNRLKKCLNNQPLSPLLHIRVKKNFQVSKCITLQVIIARDSDPHMFLIFFLTLAGCSLISVPVTWFVNNKLKLGVLRVFDNLRVNVNND